MNKQKKSAKSEIFGAFVALFMFYNIAMHSKLDFISTSLYLAALTFVYFQFIFKVKQKWDRL